VSHGRKEKKHTGFFVVVVVVVVVVARTITVNDGCKRKSGVLFCRQNVASTLPGRGGFKYPLREGGWVVVMVVVVVGGGGWVVVGGGALTPRKCARHHGIVKA